MKWLAVKIRTGVVLTPEHADGIGKLLQKQMHRELPEELSESGERFRTEGFQSHEDSGRYRSHPVADIQLREE